MESTTTKMAIAECCVLFFVLQSFQVQAIFMKKEGAVFDPQIFASASGDCDSSTIPVMADFDIKRFSGKWFELAKTSSGYIDVSDGAWKIEGTNTTNKFLFSGRDNNQHCIRPIKGSISASKEPPGMLTLKYQTYSTHVEETIRVLFTDYVSVAVIYTCMHHVHHEAEVCHAAGLLGAIWTRRPHVDVEVYENAANYLEMACVHKTTLIIRNIVGPCKVDDLDFRIDDFPAPDYCYQPVDLGSCRGSLQRFHFDPKEKTCKSFNYGGCAGNKNNFMSLPECRQKCITTSKQDPVCMSIAKCAIHCSPCCTEDESGCVKCSCEHIIEEDLIHCMKNPSQCPDDCKTENLYPGCYICRCGEDPKFEDRSNGVCNEAKEMGRCYESIQRFYYNAIDDLCEPFTYSGCKGTNNNFETLEECKVKCQISDKILIEQGDMLEPGGSTVLNINIWLFFMLLLMCLR